MSVREVEVKSVASKYLEVEAALRDPEECDARMRSAVDEAAKFAEIGADEKLVDWAKRWRSNRIDTPFRTYKVYILEDPTVRASTAGGTLATPAMTATDAELAAAVSAVLPKFAELP